MESGRNVADIAIVGGGPAGGAAAIACAQRGLRVTLLERDPARGNRPGETLHPGIEPVLAQLGLAGRLAGVVGACPAGTWIEWGGSRRFQAFGADQAGPWFGFQVRRADFDALLVERARELGAEIRHRCAALAPLVEDGVVRGVDTANGPVPARIVIDASGRSRWLARALGLGNERRSPRLIARYGYASGSLPERDDAPLLRGNASAWTWIARVGPDLYQWTHLPLSGAEPGARWTPEETAELVPVGRSRGADVTWRRLERPAGPGWFAAGDAAATLDPTSGRGVLKAVMSGIMAAHLSSGVLASAMPPVAAAHAYVAWLGEWFDRDARQLAAFYRELGVDSFR